jgi:DNA-binding beta-propeller fold protein YncE
VATIPIPNDGGVGVGAGRVWVIDRSEGLLEIDPATNQVESKVSGVVGAAPVVGEGAVWVPSGIVFNTLFRVGLVTHAVSEVATGPSSEEWPSAAALTPGAVWVGNHHGGTIARVDPTTSAVVASVPWGEHLNGGPYHMTADGSRVWVTASRTRDVAEIDTATNAIVRRVPVPTGTCGGMAADAGAVWATSGYDRPYPCWFTASWGVARVDRTTGNVTRIDVGGRPIDVRLAYGSAWVLVDAPQLALVRVNPQTYRVVGRLPLNPDRCEILKTGNCPGAEYATALEAGFGSLWIRRAAAASNLAGARATGALLRVNPSR